MKRHHWEGRELKLQRELMMTVAGREREKERGRRRGRRSSQCVIIDLDFMLAIIIIKMRFSWK